MIASYGEDTLVISEDSICIGLPISVSIKGRSADGYQNWRFPLGNVLKVSVLDSTEFLLYPTSSGVVSVTPVHSCNSSIAALTKDIIVYQMPIGTAGADQKYQGFPVGAKLQGLHANPELGVKYKYEWNVVKGTATIASANTLTTTILPKEVETHYQLTISSPNEKACVLVDEVIVMFEIVVNPPLIFSPNGDGKNDTWEVPELEFFPDASIEIFNQWGLKVYSKSKGYFTEPWNGTNEGVELPIATYYYVITPNKPGYSTKAGAVTLVK
jgi:gliding motility-associated-like protein